MIPLPFVHVVLIPGYTAALSYCERCVGAVQDRAEASQVFTVDEVAEMDHDIFDTCMCCGYRFVTRAVA